MVKKKVLVPLFANEVAPRFDLATEVFIASVQENGDIEEGRNVVLPRPSSEQLSHLILTEGVQAVICGGIEEEYHQYLTWKKIAVIDSVMAPLDAALERFARGALSPGDVLFEKRSRPSRMTSRDSKTRLEKGIEKGAPDKNPARG